MPLLKPCFKAQQAAKSQTALVLFKEYPLVCVKPSLPLAVIPQQGAKVNLTAQRLIKMARAIRVVAFGLRATFVGVIGFAMYSSKFNAQDAPEIVKDFCYQEAGRRNFNIKTEYTYSHNFSSWGNTLYVPHRKYDSLSLKSILKERQMLRKFQQELAQKESLASVIIQSRFNTTREDKKQEIAKAIEVNEKQLNLYRGILDHEMGHLNNYDCYRLPFLLGGSLVGMEHLWGKLRPRLESSFIRSCGSFSNSNKRIVLLAGRWLTKLVVPTMLYTGTFFAARQLIKKTIEAQADANVRDDLAVLTEMENFFRQNAKKNRESMAESANSKDIYRYALNRMSAYGFLFFDSHPSDESRANYFAERIEKLGKQSKI